MTYDYTYFHKILLEHKNLYYEAYKDKTELDILIEQLDSEIIYNYHDIDWSAFKYRMVRSNAFYSDADEEPFPTITMDGCFEGLANELHNRQVRVKFLSFVQKNLDLIWPDWDNIGFIEDECARLISRNIRESVNDRYLGEFARMPRTNLVQLLSDPDLFTKKTPHGEWTEKWIKERQNIAGQQQALFDVDMDKWAKIEKVFLQFADQCADPQNPCPVEKIWQKTQQQIDIFRRLDAGTADVWEFENRISMELMGETGHLFMRRTPAYQVLALMYLLIMTKQIRSTAETCFAQSIASVIFENPEFHCTKEMVNNAIESINAIIEEGARVARSIQGKTLTDIINENNQLHQQQKDNLAEIERLQKSNAKLQDAATHRINTIEQLRDDLENANIFISKYIHSGTISTELLFQKADEIDSTDQLNAVKLYLHAVGLDQQRVNRLKGNKAKTPMITPPRTDYCTYIVTDADKSREEIEADIERASHKSASIFARLLKSYKDHGFLDFRGESASDIYNYFKNRYPHLSFGVKTFQDEFKAS